MLNDEQLEAYFSEHKLSGPVREYIRLTRSAPSRLVGTNAPKNLVTSFVSSKMGRSIQTESRTAEYTVALELEYSRDVLEFWDQPEPVIAFRTYSNGKKRPGSYIPDFLALTATGPEVIEVKPEDALRRLAEKNPTDWARTDGHLTYRPGVAAFRTLGLAYRVVSTAELSPIRAANLKLLLQARYAPDAVTPALQGRALQALSQKAWMRLSELGAQLDLVDLTPLVQLIERNVLCASLSEELLSQPDSAWISSSQDILDTRKAMCPCDTSYELPPRGNTPVALSHVPTERQAQHALRALERIKSGEKSRYVRRLRKRIKELADQGIGELQALVPKDHLKGNRKRRLHQACTDFLASFFENHYATPIRYGKSKAFAIYRQLATEFHPHLRPVCRKTFGSYLDRLDRRTVSQGRGGIRAANAASEPVPVESRQLRATRPFELAMMDHYEADIFCVVVAANGVAYVARPWISALIDTFTGRILAVWISFRPPSTRSCAMVLRLCVRKHGRLPEVIMVDRGPEFGSVYFHALLAHCGVDLVLRPAAHARFGDQVERLFGLFKTQWLSLRPGNLVHYKEVRAISSSHAPQNHAALTIEHLLSELLEFVDWHNANVVGIRDRSPDELFRSGLERFGCSGRLVVDDHRFTVASAVDVREYSIDPSRGLHIDNLHYWHPALKQLAARRRPATVRLEPEDPYRVYALVGDEWVTCLASGEQAFQAMDPIVRLSQAVRILDGTKAFVQAKADAEQRLIKRIREIDKGRTQDPQNAQSSATADTSERSAQDIFRELQDADVPALTLTDWEG